MLTTYHSNSEAEISARHAADMRSDSWLSKNIRPMTLVYLMVVVSACAFTDGNIGQFKINPAYVKLFESLLLVAFAFYFGSRGMEKVMKSVSEYKVKSNRAENIEARAELIRAKAELKAARKA